MCIDCRPVAVAAEKNHETDVYPTKVRPHGRVPARVHAVNPSLLQRIALGEASAIRECVEQYGRLVWSIARRLTRTQTDAEDATQDIFLDIWRHAGRFDETRGSELTFIVLIARRRAIDRLRKSTTQPVMESFDDILDTLVAAEDDSREFPPSWDADQALLALARLRPTYRQVLELGFLHGLTQFEIAARLHMPLGTVKSSMRRGLLQLRDHLNATSSPGPASAPLTTAGGQGGIRVIASLYPVVEPAIVG